MDIDSHIADILTYYWLVENPCCGLAESKILERLTERDIYLPTIDELHLRLLAMQARGQVIIDLPRADPHVFPTRVLLEPRDPAKESEVGVYTKQLRLGGFQTELRYFDRKVLERYRQDPRYEFKEGDISGRITTPSDAPDMPPNDRVTLMRFGTAYVRDGTPVVAAILFDLGQLSKEHQHYWVSYEIHERCQPDPDFIAQNFDAQPIQRVSPSAALLAEIREINKICNFMGEPNLFRNTYEPYGLTKLGRITKPTAEEFRSFVHELDKLLSDNINRQFFDGKVALKDTKGQERGTLSLLEAYLQCCVPGTSLAVVKRICKPLKKVRKCRQIPAHTIAKNKFDTDYWAQQRNLLIETLKAIDLLRIVLAGYPSLEGYMPPKWFAEWRIE